MAAVGKVLIQGGGVGGLVLATALGQRGVAVDVVEAAGPEAVLGVGLNQPANAQAALGEIGVREQCLDVGFPFEDLVFWNPEGEQVAAIPPPAGPYAKPSNNAIGRPVYNRILREAAEKAGARTRTGVTIWDMTEDTDGVDVELATWTGKRTPPVRDARSRGSRYDLVVGFDGVRSTVREHLFGDTYTPEYTGSGNWRVSVPRPDFIEHIVVAFAEDVKAVLTPTSRDEMYFGLVTPEPGNPRHAPEDLYRLFLDRTRVFSGRLGALRDGITPEHRIVYTPMEYLTVREPWFRGRIAIAGDAAHTSPPHLSQGAAMAVEDAVTLAAALDEHTALPDALHAWFERRRDRALFVADASLALLKQESGTELTAAEAALVPPSAPPPQSRPLTEIY
jgi:2-polyprenyl-6-methoxyphenol hydroxylase-like FAD-dependent oxidoreductase